MTSGLGKEAMGIRKTEIKIYYQGKERITEKKDLPTGVEGVQN